MWRKKTLKLFFFTFLLLHTIPLVDRYLYETITKINYSIVLPTLTLLSIRKLNSPSSFIQLLIIVISVFFLLIGKSGTIFALVLSASSPYFIFQNFKTKDDLIEFCSSSIIKVSVFLIITSIVLFYLVSSKLIEFYFLGEYFIIASINYVPLLFWSFSILLLIRSSIVKYNLKEYSFTGIIILLGIFFSLIFLTRSTLIALFALLLMHYRKYWKLILFNFAIVVFLYIPEIREFSISYMGSDNVSEIAEDDRRLDSILLLINDSVNFGYDFRKHMSFSSLINLLFSIFPFTLFYLIPLSRPVFKFFFITNFINFYLFLLCIFIIAYQMDFFSVFTLFFLLEFFKFNKNNLLNEVS